MLTTFIPMVELRSLITNAFNHAGISVFLVFVSRNNVTLSVLLVLYNFEVVILTICYYECVELNEIKCELSAVNWLNARTDKITKSFTNNIESCKFMA